MQYGLILNTLIILKCSESSGDSILIGVENEPEFVQGFRGKSNPAFLPENDLEVNVGIPFQTGIITRARR